MSILRMQGGAGIGRRKQRAVTATGPAALTADSGTTERRQQRGASVQSVQRRRALLHSCESLRRQAARLRYKAAHLRHNVNRAGKSAGERSTRSERRRTIDSVRAGSSSPAFGRLHVLAFDLPSPTGGPLVDNLGAAYNGVPVETCRGQTAVVGKDQHRQTRAQSRNAGL